MTFNNEIIFTAVMYLQWQSHNLHFLMHPNNNFQH